MAYVFRERCEPELLHVGQLVRRDDIAIDIGAHYGSYTIALSRLVGPAGIVIAIEPAQHAHEVLLSNVALNNLSNVRVLRLALGAEPAAGFLHHLSKDPSRHCLDHTAAPAAEGEHVNIQRLDDLVAAQRIDRVAFLKMDIEGAELLALRGAAQILRRHRPIVLFELQPQAASKMGLPRLGAWEFLTEQGYAMHHMDRNGLLRGTVAPPSNGCINLVAIPG